MSGRLVCPSCGLTHGADERFCVRCGIPLVVPDLPVADAPVSETRARARKVQARYTEGDLVTIAGARHQAEAEMIQGLLLEEGIPSILRRTRGFDVPDMLAAGPRDVLVARSAEEDAREALQLADVPPSPLGGPAGDRPLRVLAVLSGGVAMVALIAWAVAELPT